MTQEDYQIVMQIFELTTMLIQSHEEERRVREAKVERVKNQNNKNGIRLAWVNPEAPHRAATPPMVEEKQIIEQERLSGFKVLTSKEEEEIMKLPKKAKLRQRPNGTYEIRYSLNGYRYSVYGKTTKEVYGKFLKHKRDNPGTGPLKSTLLYDWLDKYLEIKKPLIKPHSWKCIETAIRLHIKPAMKNKQLKTFTALEIQEVLNGIKLGKTREYSAGVLSEAFKIAVENGLLSKNVCENARVKKHVREEGRAMTQAEQKEFFSVVNKNCLHKWIFYFYYFTGCRKSEAFRVKLSHVDYDKELLFIDGTKNAFSKRYIPLFPGLKRILPKIEASAKEYLFEFSESTLKRDVEKIKENLTFDFSIKDLRTTFGTMQAESGVSLKTLQKWMGHARASTTERYYVKVLSEFERKEAEKFNPDFDD